jgi:hypothetical protein
MPTTAIGRALAYYGRYYPNEGVTLSLAVLAGLVAVLWRLITARRRRDPTTPMADAAGPAAAGPLATQGPLWTAGGPAPDERATEQTTREQTTDEPSTRERTTNEPSTGERTGLADAGWLAATGLTLIVTSVATSMFEVRYGEPAFLFLPMAAALPIAAAARGKLRPGRRRR